MVVLRGQRHVAVLTGRLCITAGNRQVLSLRRAVLSPELRAKMAELGIMQGAVNHKIFDLRPVNP